MNDDRSGAVRADYWIEEAMDYIAWAESDVPKDRTFEDWHDKATILLRAVLRVVRLAATPAAAPELRDAAREVVRFYGTDRTWSLLYRELLGSRIDDLAAALDASPAATEPAPSLIGRWRRGGFHAPICWQAWIDSGGEAGCICSIAR